MAQRTGAHAVVYMQELWGPSLDPWHPVVSPLTSPLSPAMDEVSDSALQTQSPIRTEWNSKCVIFTYFRGDINKEVDEHFSRALGLSVSSLQELSPSSQRREDVILTNETDLAPNQWRFSAPWTKPQLGANLGNGGANCSATEFDPVEVNPYPITTTRSLLAQPDQPWQLPTVPFSNSSLDLTYPSSFSVTEAPVPVPEPQQEERYESLLNFLQQDRSPALPEQPVSWDDGYSAQRPGNSGMLFNFPPNSSSAQSIAPGDACGSIWNSTDRTLVSCMQDKKTCFPPVCEPFSTGYAEERNLIPETSKNLFY